ncbi:MAG TPA: hypothetical protein PL029_03465 [Bacteroidia bacterium]|nr:hypothetical protein [Bacteroidia bacterium]
MKNKTVRVIVILVGLLVLNIEAAHAGITHKFKVFINHELSDFQLMYVSFGLLSLSVLGYIIFMPAFKDKGNFAGGAAYFQNYTTHTYQHKRKRIKKIAQILKNAELSEYPHS